MKNLSAATLLCGVSAVAALLAACTSGPQVFAPNGAASMDDVLLAKHPAAPAFAHPNAGKSWMEPNVKGPLLYVADAGNDDVFVYTWPALSLIGNLSGFQVPQGECVDAAGNVWVANTKTSKMLEFARGGLKPIKTLKDRGQFPSSCAIDPKTGDLAVTNIISRSYGPGSLSIYKAAGGAPKIFADPNLEKVYFDGYDGKGNLYVDGIDASGIFQIAKFDGKKFTALRISGANVNAPGAVQVVGSTINVEDQSGVLGNSVMYETTLAGSTLTVVATAQLTDGMDCVGTFIAGGAKHEQAICPDAATPAVYVYDYPAGGSPTKSVLTGLSDPEGAVITR
jgi:hypothetical protein